MENPEKNSAGRKKILFVITKGVWGGAQKYVFDLAVALKDTADVVVVYGTEGELRVRLNQQGIRTLRIESLGRNINPLLDVSSFFSLLRIFNKEMPGVVHLNSSKIGGLGAVAGRIAGIKKIVFTAHGWVFNEERGAVSKSILWFLSWLTALFSTDVIVLGKREQRQTLAMPFVSEKKVAMIRLGITAGHYFDQGEAREILRKKLGLPENFFLDKKVIGTVSELTPNKGLRYAIEALSLAVMADPSIVFIIIGSGELEPSLRSLIREQGLEKNVFLAGFIQDAGTLLKAFDILLLSSIKEGLPYILLEAGVAGVPVIATSVGNIPELITNNISGLLVPPKNSACIREIVAFALAHPDKLENYAASLRRHIEKEFSQVTMIRDTEAVYNS